jgi:hypothetical protein
LQSRRNPARGVEQIRAAQEPVKYRLAEKRPRFAPPVARRLLLEGAFPLGQIHGESERAMSQRDANLLWLKDVIDHMRACGRDLQLTEDPEAVHVLTESMLRDLECCRRLCDTLRRRTLMAHAV